MIGLASAYSFEQPHSAEAYVNDDMAAHVGIETLHEVKHRLHRISATSLRAGLESFTWSTWFMIYAPCV